MHFVKEIAKRYAFLILGSSAATARRISRIAESGKSIILNLHRVAAADGSAYRPLDPKLFKELLAFLQKRFDVVPLEALAERGPRPKVVLSFDDGYRDFIEVAAPILDSFRIRANQNIIPDCIESGLPPLNVLAQDFVGKAPPDIVRRVEVPGFMRLEPTPACGARLSTFIKNKPRAEQKKLFGTLYSKFGVGQSFEPTRMMTRDEVRQISSVHDIGAHSFSHASMGVETDEYLREDLRRCEEYMRNELGLPMLIYAFSNGSYRPEQVDIVRHSGVRHILLVDDNFAGEALVRPRFGFDAKSLPEARFKALGGLRSVK